MSNKALIIVDYSFDFIDDNGKLTCGKPGNIFPNGLAL